jgi:group I intron endonuclease
MTQGIYKISDPSGEFYIGSSCNIERRFVQHRSEMRRGCHTNRRLKRSHEQHGDQLQFEIIFCVLDAKNIVEAEQCFIDLLQPTLNLSMVAMNSMLDPDVRRLASERIRLSEKHALARALNQKKAASAVSKRVVRLTDGAIFSSTYEAARSHGIEHKDNLSTAIKNGWNFAGHFWKYETSSKTLEQAREQSAEQESIRKRNAAAAATKAKSKKVMRLSDGMVFESAVEAARQINGYRTIVTDAIRLNAVRAGSRWAYV